MPQKRNGFIDIMKMIFCMGVILNHLNTVSISSQMNSIVMRYGFLGVEFFFIVSGYLMAKNAARTFNHTVDIGPTTWNFLLHKIMIIFQPILWLG